MDQQQKRNRKLILIIASMAVVPVFMAWMLRYNPDWISGRSNKGELITPPISTERTEFIGFDQFSKDNLNELKGRWVMVNLIPDGLCDDICRDALLKTRQLRLMMNKDLTRIRRVVVIMDKVNENQAKEWWKDDDRLLRARTVSSLTEKINTVSKGKEINGTLLLMDPLGNLMMRYQSGFNPYDVQSDLKKLLRISQIG